MSSAEQENQENTTQEESVSLLEQCITNTKKTERDYAQEMIQSLTEQAMEGTVKFGKSTSHTIKAMISAIDDQVSKQLTKVLHHEKFQKLEGSWRGVQHLVSRSLTGPDLKIKLLDIRKKELYKDIEVDIESSCMWQKLYSEDFDRLGGQPFGAVVGDYQFGNNPEDIKLLEQMSHISASAFCPFLTSPSPDLLQLDSWDELARVDRKGNLMDIFDGVEYAQWRGFRDSEDSRYVCLTMPRTLARLPWGAGGKSVDERIMDFQELPVGKDGKPVTASGDQFCWMSTAYVMAERLANSYSMTGFCTAIRGVQNGGKVEGLPAYTFKNEDGALDLQCPTEIGIGDRLEAELGTCGLLPLVHHKNADHAVFIGGETSQKAKTYQGKGGKDASENAQISARLPYVMASSRFAHYLKTIARDWIGSFKEEGDLQSSLEDWIGNYVSEAAKGDDRARYPLKAAKIEVKPVAGKSGAYNAVAYLQPWLQMEELTTSLRMVARIPGGKG